ncbi:class I SAM-dependent methyltransferase [Rhizomonospora bruguierae]|uniref:class I SAM-dependent methyltransferase n=1 Tax=Rhizomonospora bruguierae TaxID=1581705 RepID=UPI001BCBB019|nr:class I SAM-dependent methyltransferase [Micromonospora sp. NBRC 107566]
MRRNFKLVPEMEGPVARWYARQRGSASQLAGYHDQAAALAAELPVGIEILEVAPGPGYMAVELARLGHRVTGLDISRTFVGLAAEYARGQGVTVDFRQGDVGAMPFGDDAFDLVVCQAAFKNFLRPVRALNEMYRVLHAGGTAVIDDMNRDATRAQIAEEVGGMGLSGPNVFLTRTTLGWLRRRAMSPRRFRELAAESAFGGAEITAHGIGLRVRLTK